MPELSPEILLSPLAAYADARIGWIAYSGGADSTVLLHALAAIRDRLAFELRALHVDHRLHPDSRTWVEHCVRTCQGLEVPLQTRSISIASVRGESPEARARQARYDTMTGFLGRGDLLLTAQHRDDQAETLLLALMRGSGPAGLAAMPSVAPLGLGRLVRPLLEYSRAELLDYANRRSLTWLEDPSNRDLGFDRNFLRHRVLPLLEQRWPACAASISRSAAHCAEAQDIIDLFAADELPRVAGQRPDTVSISHLATLRLSMRKQVLRRWLRGLGFAPPDSRHLNRIIGELMTARRDANPLVAWPGCQVRRYRNELFAMAPLPPTPSESPIHWDKGILTLPEGLGRLELLATDRRPVDPVELFIGGVEVGFGIAGLSCRPYRGRHHRSLKKLYQEAAVPPWVRPYVPLIFGNGGLVAVAGAWSCYFPGGEGKPAFRFRWASPLRRWFPREELHSSPPRPTDNNP